MITVCCAQCRASVSACSVRVRVVGFCHCAHVRCPCRWVHCVRRVLLQHPGRSAVSVPCFGPCVLVKHRSHFGSRYKLGCCGHAGLFYVRWWSLGGGVAGRFVRLGAVDTSCWSAACTYACLGVFVSGGTRSYDVFCLCFHVRWFSSSRWFSQPTVRDCWQPLASRLPQEKYCYG